MTIQNGHQTDITIATLLNNELKSCAATTAKSACECVTPEFRNALSAISQDAIRRQERLATMMSQKGWYVAPQADASTLNMLMPQLQNATRGIEGAQGALGGATNITGGIASPGTATGGFGGGTTFTPPRV